MQTSLQGSAYGFGMVHSLKTANVNEKKKKIVMKQIDFYE